MFGIDDAIGGVAGLASGLIGMFAGNPGQKYLDEADKYYKDINPNVTAQNVANIRGTAFNNADPTGKMAMQDVLQNLQAKYRNGGLDAVDRAKMAQMQQQAAQAGHANAAGIADAARSRGMLNSGAALVQQQVAQQQASQNAMNAALGQGAIAEQARMSALQGAAGVGNQLQQNAFQVANANDALNRFNAQLQEGNANRGLQAQQWSTQNALGRAQGVGGLAGAGNKAGAQQAQQMGGLGKAAGALGQGIYNWAGGLGGGGGGTGGSGADTMPSGAGNYDESAGLNTGQANYGHSDDESWGLNTGYP